MKHLQPFYSISPELKRMDRTREHLFCYNNLGLQDLFKKYLRHRRYILSTHKRAAQLGTPSPVQPSNCPASLRTCLCGLLPQSRELSCPLSYWAQFILPMAVGLTLLRHKIPLLLALQNTHGFYDQVQMPQPRTLLA